MSKNTHFTAVEHILNQVRSVLHLTNKFLISRSMTSLSLNLLSIIWPRYLKLVTNLSPPSNFMSNLFAPRRKLTFRYVSAKTMWSCLHSFCHNTLTDRRTTYHDTNWNSQYSCKVRLKLIRSKFSMQQKWKKYKIWTFISVIY